MRTSVGAAQPSMALWALVAVLGVLLFVTAVVVGTDSLSTVPHPAFLDGVIHEEQSGHLHFWGE